MCLQSFTQTLLCFLQDMDGKEVEGRFLGVKHDKFNVPGGEREAAGGSHARQPSGPTLALSYPMLAAQHLHACLQKYLSL